MTFDCFSFFNELDLLEIRFNILDPHVDRFVIMESTETFSGKENPLYYQENKERFAEWNHKVISVNPPKIDASSAFIRAEFQKESLKNGLSDAKDGDIIYYGDLDEIWKLTYEMEALAKKMRAVIYCKQEAKK